jgi:hypothetical protein
MTGKSPGKPVPRFAAADPEKQSVKPLGFCSVRRADPPRRQLVDLDQIIIRPRGDRLGFDLAPPTRPERVTENPLAGLAFRLPKAVIPRRRFRAIGRVRLSSRR